MDKKELVEKCYKLMIKAFNPNSKYYKEDCQELKTHLKSKSLAKLKEIYQRQSILNKDISEREIDLICNTDFLR